jgi:hypothetical protein
MAVNLSPVGGVAAQFFTNTGAVLTGGKIYTYLAGTTTPATTYTSSQGTTAHANPIVLDAAGRVPSGEIWLTDGINYKFVLKDSNDVLIATYDNISGINSNFLAFVNQQQIITATANQTVFNLSISYQPGTNSLSVFVDGVNQYGPGAQYAYTETDSDTVTFVSGLHVGAEVKFTTTQQQSAGAIDSSQVTYDPPYANSVATNVEAKLAQYVSVIDFGADKTGSIDSSAAFTAAIATGSPVYVPPGTYLCNITITTSGATLVGAGREKTIVKNFSDNPVITISNASNSLRGIRLEGIYFANRNKVTYPNAVGLLINGAVGANENDFHQFMDLTFFEFNYGVLITGRSIWNRWIRCSFLTSLLDGFVSDSTNNQALQYYETCRWANNGRYGLFVNHTFANFLLDGWTFINCNWENNISVPVRITGTYGVQNWSFIGCYSEENASGISPGSTNPVKSGFAFIDSPYAFGVDFKNCTFAGNTSVADPDYYIYVSGSTIEVFGSVDLCRFDTAVIYSVFWPEGVSLGRNRDATYSFDRALNSTSLNDTIIPATWTPALEIGGATTGITYSNQVGRLTILGKTVFFEGYLSLSSKGSATGDVALTGLPFTANNVTNLSAVVQVSISDVTLGSYVDVCGLIAPNTSKISLIGLLAGVRTALTNTQLGNSSNFRITGHYQIV